MKRLAAILITLTAMGCSRAQDDTTHIAVRTGAKWGYIDRSGRIVIEQKYDSADSFSEGLAAVRQGNLWGFIDGKGVFVIKPAFPDARRFQAGMAAVSTNYMGIVTSGDVAFGGISISQGLVTKWGAIDRTGKILVGTEFDYPVVFSQDLALVRQGAYNNFYVKKLGQKAFNSEGFDYALSFSEGLAAVGDGATIGVPQSPWFYIDQDGRTAIPGPYDRAGSFSAGLAPTRQRDDRSRWTYINKAGEPQFSIRAESAESFSEGLAAITVDGKIGFISPKGAVLIPPQFDATWNFSQGLAAVKRDRKWGFINPSGQVVIDLAFDQAGSFHDGMARVVDSAGKQALIDRKGKPVLPVGRYDEIAW